MNEVPQPIAELVEYLIKSGTGKAKVDKVIELGKTCDGAEQFLEEAKKVLPEGTLLKIYTFIEGKKLPPPLVPTQHKVEQEQIQQEPTPQPAVEQPTACPITPQNEPEEAKVESVKEEPKQGKKKK